MLDVLYTNVTTELSDYNAANAGYDSLFGYYQTYIKDEIPSLLDSFMGWGVSGQFDVTAPGNKYFDCTYYDVSKKKNDTTQPCPVELAGENFEVYWTLINSTRFYADLQDNYGISADWVVLTDENWSTCVSDDPLTVPCVSHHEVWHGYPLMRFNVTNGSGSDVIQAFAMPVAMVSQAIQAMDQVKVLGKTEKEEEKKKLISLVLTTVLGVVLFVGEAGAELAGLATIASTIAIAGEVANAAFTIYTMVEDPASAPMSALGLLFGIGGIAAVSRDAEGLARVAALRREMTADDVAAMGATVEDQAASVQKIIKDCSL
ncbi:hypothetical protein NHQ30_007064 [Ciborinia camelliae]|nr:hypothetical protein NHQ30_007064 [Ciborinia camelliae]